MQHLQLVNLRVEGDNGYEHRRTINYINSDYSSCSAYSYMVQKNR